MSQKRVLPDPDEPMTQVVEVAGVGRVLGPGVHGEKLRPGQNDVVFKLGIDKGLDVFFGAPAGRSVFFIPPKFLCVLAFHIDQQAEAHRAPQCR